jgi:hypothetical protein
MAISLPYNRPILILMLDKSISKNSPDNDEGYYSCRYINGIEGGLYYVRKKTGTP